MPSLDRAKKWGSPRPEPPERSARRPSGAHGGCRQAALERESWAHTEPADCPGISRLPHGAIHTGASPTYARYRTPEKSQHLATSALPRRFLLVSVSGKNPGSSQEPADDPAYPVTGFCSRNGIEPREEHYASGLW
ncbi:unnamed protein product, partial [Ectocarpus fasciculatus]